MGCHSIYLWTGSSIEQWGTCQSSQILLRQSHGCWKCCPPPRSRHWGWRGGRECSRCYRIWSGWPFCLTSFFCFSRCLHEMQFKTRNLFQISVMIYCIHRSRWDLGHLLWPATFYIPFRWSWSRSFYRCDVSWAGTWRESSSFRLALVYLWRQKYSKNPWASCSCSFQACFLCWWTNLRSSGPFGSSGRHLSSSRPYYSRTRLQRCLCFRRFKRFPGPAAKSCLEYRTFEPLLNYRYLCGAHR